MICWFGVIYIRLSTWYMISVVIQQSIRTVYQRKTVIRQKLDMAEKEDIVEFLSCKQIGR